MSQKVKRQAHKLKFLIGLTYAHAAVIIEPQLPPDCECSITNLLFHIDYRLQMKHSYSSVACSQIYCI